MITLDTGTLAPHLTEDDLKNGMPGAMEALGSLVRGEGAGSDMLGWLALPCLPPRDIEEITGVGKRIREQSDCLVVVGIGGSYLGARAGIEALKNHAPFPVLFAGNSLSPEYHAGLSSCLQRLFCALGNEVSLQFSEKCEHSGHDLRLHALAI